MRHLGSLRRLRETSGKIRAALSTVHASQTSDDALAFVEEVRALSVERRALLFAFGERDIGTVAEFEQHLASVFREARSDCRVVLVADGDHTFSSIEARDRVIGETIAWLAPRREDRRRGECSVSPAHVRRAGTS